MFKRRPPVPPIETFGLMLFATTHIVVGFDVLHYYHKGSWHFFQKPIADVALTLVAFSLVAAFGEWSRAAILRLSARVSSRAVSGSGRDVTESLIADVVPMTWPHVLTQVVGWSAVLALVEGLCIWLDGKPFLTRLANPVTWGAIVVCGVAYAALWFWIIDAVRRAWLQRMVRQK